MKVKIEVSHSVAGFPVAAGHVYDERHLTRKQMQDIATAGRGEVINDEPAPVELPVAEPTPEPPAPPPAEESGASADAAQALATLTEKLGGGEPAPAEPVQREISGAEALTRAKRAKTAQQQK